MRRPEPERPKAIEQVRQQLQHWRDTRPHRRAPIPSSLWAEAVALARQHGLYQTARALPIHYGGLKKRLEAADRTGVVNQLQFVELKPTPATVPGDYVIEVDGPRTTIRLHLHGVGVSDVARLSRALTGMDE